MPLRSQIHKRRAQDIIWLIEHNDRKFVCYALARQTNVETVVIGKSVDVAAAAHYSLVNSPASA